MLLTLKIEKPVGDIPLFSFTRETTWTIKKSNSKEHWTELVSPEFCREVSRWLQRKRYFSLSLLMIEHEQHLLLTQYSMKSETGKVLL